jgi:hypothetical protein
MERAWKHAWQGRTLHFSSKGRAADLAGCDAVQAPPLGLTLVIGDESPLGSPELRFVGLALFKRLLSHCLVTKERHK